MDDDLKTIIFGFMGVFCCGLLLFGFIALVGSMETLEITEIGLDFDTTRVKIDDSQTYGGGRHFIGLTHKFLVF